MTILGNIITLLDGSELFNKIDEPLDNALQSFKDIPSGNINHKEFNRVIAGLIEHLYKYGLRIPREINGLDALKEALWITEKYYKGDEIIGYDGALYDAVSHGHEGLETVIERIVEIIKSIERKKFISWVITKAIDPFDWSFKKKMVEELIEKYGYLLKPDIKELSYSQLTPHLEELIIIVITSDHILTNSLIS